MNFWKNKQAQPCHLLQVCREKNYITSSFKSEPHFGKITALMLVMGWHEDAGGNRCVQSEQGQSALRKDVCHPNYQKSRHNAATSLPGSFHFCVLSLSFSAPHPIPTLCPCLLALPGLY